MPRASAAIRFALAAITVGIYPCACDRSTGSPTTRPANPTVASMVPAATDLIVGMGARDRLVAVSTYDRARADVGSLPKAGDYETVDWETLRVLHPAVLITEIQPQRMSPGFAAHADALHIAPVNITVEKLAEIFTALHQLGDVLNEPALAITAEQQMHARLDAVRQRVANQPKVSTLLILGPNADSLAGPGNYLDDLLQLAGGTNAAAKLEQHWPEIDREMLLTLAPQAIIQLMPDATPQQLQQAADVWKKYPTLPAVAAGRVYTIDDTYAETPGWHVTDLAEKFAQCLHPTPSTTKP